MSSLTESVISRARDRRNGPARTAESIGGKRKHRDSSDTGDVSKGATTNHASSSTHHASSSITSPPTIGRGKRFRRWSGSTVNPSEDPVESAPPPSVDLEGWKKHESYKRTHSFIRDPLGLDPNPPPPLPLPSTVRSNHNGGHARFRPRAYSHRQSKDRVINPPKQVMCPDPLQLEVKIQAYQESHRRHESDGLTKSERIAERYVDFFDRLIDGPQSFFLSVSCQWTQGQLIDWFVGLWMYLLFDWLIDWLMERPRS